MAIFGAGGSENYQEIVFKSADGILKKLAQMNESETNEINIGIGIHSGEVIAGNIGTHERQQFSISGIPVIVASRLEQMTKEYDCSWLVSSTFYKQIKDHTPNGESLGKVKMKGLDKELEVKKCVNFI